MYQRTIPNTALLIKTLPKNLKTLPTKCLKTKWEIAENIVHFIKDQLPKAYPKLKFKPQKDNLDTLLNKCAEILFEHQFTIKYDDYDTNDKKQISFIKDTYFDPYDKTLNAATILQLKPPLRVGLAKFIVAYRNVVLDYTNVYKNQEITLSFEGMESEIESRLEELENPKDKKKFLKELKLLKERLERLQRKIEKYSQQDISVFQKYNPRSTKNILLKNCIEALLNCQIGEGKIFDLMENIDSVNDGFLHFRDLFYIHSNETIQQEANYYTEQQINYSYYSEPCQYFAYQNGICISQTSPQTLMDFQTLNENLTFFNQLTN